MTAVQRCDQLAVLPGGVVCLDKSIVPEVELPLHRHAMGALTLVLEGGFEEEFEPCRTSYSRWNLQFKPPGLPHTTATGADGGRLFIVALAPGKVARHDGLRRVDTALDIGPGVGTALALGLHRATQARQNLQARSWWAALSRRLDLEARVHTAPQEEPWMANVEGRIRDRPHLPWSLDRVARDAGVHPVYLARVFRRTFGCSLGRYVHGQRIDRCIARLTEPDANLGQLAQDLGFSDQSHLSRVFRRESGWTPARLRRALAPTA